MRTKLQYVIPSHLIKRMQSVMNSAARLVFSASKYDRITLFLTAALVEGAGADLVQAGYSGLQIPTPDNSAVSQ